MMITGVKSGLLVSLPIGTGRLTEEFPFREA
jgi:exopolyphosphatase/pppGpp-phosphohydrolase